MKIIKILNKINRNNLTNKEEIKEQSLSKIQVKRNILKKVRIDMRENNKILKILNKFLNN
jgi:hypothetical protein